MGKGNFDQTREALRQWRRKSGRRPIPIEIRHSIMALAKKRGDKFVIDELGISSSSLWHWKRESTEKVNSAKNRVKKCRERVVKFVEIAGVGPGSTASAIQILFERADGNRMRVEGAVSLSEVGQLVNKFLSSAGVGP